MRQFIRHLALASIGVALASGASLANNDGSAEPAGAESGLIAIPKFAVSTPQAGDVADRIRRIIRDRLSQIGSYALSDAIDVTNIDVRRVLEFSTWRARQVQFVIVAQIAIQDDGRLKVEARMWSVPDHKQVVGRMIVYQIENWRQAAELLADEISRPLTDGVGEPR
jgi:Tol biopolymer transport system component